MTDVPFDVAIIGAGPVGCTAALLMAHQGLSVALIERETDVYDLPRAVNLDGEIIRAFQALGLAGEFAALLQKIRPGDRSGFTNSKREWLFGQEAKALGMNGWQPKNMFDQPEVDKWLRDKAIADENVTAYIGSQAVGFTDSGNQVIVDLQKVKLETVDSQSISFQNNAASQQQTIHARYLIGCDGASSFVRKNIGAGWHDLGYDQEWLVIDVTMTGEHSLPNSVLQVCDPERIHTYIATKDPFRRWEFRLNAGETREAMLDEEKIHSLITAWTPRDSYQIRRAAVYQFHAAVADRWRKGNVFLAGDAAHQTPPFLGQGLNSGLRDVINLSWKMSLVCHDIADPALLDSYQAERDAHAHDLIDWAVALGQLMEHQAATELADRENKPRPKAPKKMRSSGYGQGREQPPLREGVLINSQLSDKGSTGYLFRQPIVNKGREKPIYLDELLGPGFAIIGREKESIRLNTHSRAIVDRLNINLVNIDELDLIAGHQDRVFNDADAVIVRPDRIVFGHTDQQYSLDDLLNELAKKLSLIE